MLSGCFWQTSQKTVIAVNDRRVSVEDFSQRLINKMTDYDSLEIKNPQRVRQIKTDLIAELIEETLVENWGRSPLEKRINDSAEATLQFLNLRQNLYDQLAERVVVSDTQIEAYYKANGATFAEDKIHLRQVFVKTKEDAERLLPLLKSKKLTFAEVAHKYSQSAEAKFGGDLGWVSKGTSPAIDAAFKLPKGVSNRFFESPQGFHLFEIVEFKKTAIPPLKEVREQIIRAMKEYGLNAAYRDWLEEQTKASKVFVDAALIESLSPTYQESL